MSNFEGMEHIIKAVNDKIESLENTVEYYRNKSDKDENKILELECEIRAVEEGYRDVVRCLERRIKELETEWQGDCDKEAPAESEGEF